MRRMRPGSDCWVTALARRGRRRCIIIWACLRAILSCCCLCGSIHFLFFHLVLRIHAENLHCFHHVLEQRQLSNPEETCQWCNTELGTIPFHECIATEYHREHFRGVIYNNMYQFISWAKWLGEAHQIH